jgi:hypothetical protein
MCWRLQLPSQPMDGNGREPAGRWREVKELVEFGRLMIEPGTPTWKGGTNHRASTIELVIASLFVWWS